MTGDGQGPNTFYLVFEELALATLIIFGHGFLAIFGLATGWVVHATLAAFGGTHDPKLYGVSAKDIIEGGEIALIAVVIGAGILSAVITFAKRMKHHMEG